ncbi:MAG: PilC/PilY family type IV pilus protein [Polaromonas sp.]|nr:PilC/PilY family type IV pilus protein [Polaromonas sp.]
MRKYSKWALALSLGFSSAAVSLHAQTVAFPDSPLQTASTISVKPNLLFTLDDSGSMEQQYTADFVSNSGNYYDGGRDVRHCYDSGDNGNLLQLGSIAGFNHVCGVGDPPFMAPAFNTQYYNPAIRYRPGVLATGVEMPSQNRTNTTAWTNVRTDQFNISNFRLQSTGTTNNFVDITQFPDRVWCNSRLADPSNTTDCKVNDATTGYRYPNASFPYGRDLTGAVKYRPGQPYSWRIDNFEYCTDANMTDCVVSNVATTSGGKSYSVKSTLRFCRYVGNTDATTFNLANLDLGNCQAKFDEDKGFTYPRFLGRINLTSALAGAIARINFTSNPTASQEITSITIDGQNIINTTFEGYTSRDTLAAAVANAINATAAAAGQQEFRACVGAACVLTLGITNPGNQVVVVYPTTAPGGSIRMTGAATNNFGAPVVNGPPAGAGTRSSTTINVQSLAGAGNPATGSLSQLVVNGVNLLSAAQVFNNANDSVAVALQIANSINAGGQNGVYQATATASSVVLERRLVGAFFDGQAVTYAYAPVISTAGTAALGPNTLPNGNKTVSIQLGTNAACTAGTVNVGSVTNNTTNRNNYATLIRNAINAYPDLSATGSNQNITVTSETASSNLNGRYICFTTPSGVTLTPSSLQFTGGRSSMNGKLTAAAFSGGIGTGAPANTITAFAGGADEVLEAYRSDTATWTKAVIVTGQTYPKTSSRTDCLATACSYDEEMTNFANWYTYYRTRMQMMKTAAGRSFSTLSDNFRVGFTTINDTSGSSFVKIRDFTAAQKTAWYAKFYATNPGPATPLRQALSRSGRIFAGKNPFSTASNYEDPMQYSCQQNFVILTTDGYWNETAEDNIRGITGDRINNTDSVAGVAAPFFDGGPGSCPAANAANCLGSVCHSSTNNGKFSSCNTLADVAYYYANTDLRSSDLLNCTNQSNPSFTSLCENNVKETTKDPIRLQHMTTFTLGLGVDGLLSYQDDYETATSGDYADIRSGAQKWPQVQNLHPTAVDDLWHAAVNGRGKYFSAKNPDSLTAGLNGALAEVSSQGGSGAAAATSNLTPVSGDNFAYVGSYTTLKWTGNIEARRIDLLSGEVSAAATWCAEDVIDPVTSNISCSGTLKTQVQSGTDTRAIFTFDSAASNKLKPFLYDSLTAAQKAFFVTTGLSQYSSLDTASQAIATPTNLVKYLRGQFEYENRPANAVRAFRERERTLADIIGSQPAFVRKPVFQYNDTGYSAFVTSNTTRTGTVYVGANDGMLHAFDAETGLERWAYVPTAMLPKMRQLADYSYPTNHRFYLDGSPKAGDVYNTATSEWRTVLVGGFAAGGTGYYALDVTDPSAPKALWEFPPTSELDAGTSHSAPIFAKLNDGTWSVIVSSGYNNTGPGYVYVLNALTGAIIKKISTGTGTAADPSGLGRLTAYMPGLPFSAAITYIYGGDLKGNLWRFDPNGSATTATKIAVLTDSTGTAQPITTKPEVVKVDNQILLYVGTGKYLETSDMTSSAQQSFYGIRDTFESTGTLTNPQGVLSPVTMVDTTEADGTISRSGTAGAGTNILTGRGWFVNFTGVNERVNVDIEFINGTLQVLTNLPSNTACTAGGSSFKNYFNYRNGSVLVGSQSFSNALVVGFVTIKVGNSFIPLITLSDSPTPRRGQPVPPSSGDTAYRGKRVSWKELNVD